MSAEFGPFAILFLIQTLLLFLPGNPLPYFAEMVQTPLHVAAGYNNIEIRYGAKNGCNEAAKVLLAHGALVEARANNGMTPLHLAVWHSLRAEDYSTVKTLLEYNADCSAEDNVR
ncbi:hypothetical protein RND71_036540 [Anisodus tanguticus]|uniref:Uncharacterized protein n=1 Tax=Anisodus tanguticus TaxID=243964 RepID=A0AAE1R1X4_9SOLA|nr:hypothetical protein RND71_036540 [Anisodus tanguticus]